MLRRLFSSTRRYEIELNLLLWSAARFNYDEQDRAVQDEARACLREIYRLMCRCQPTKDNCFPRSYMEVGKFEFLKCYAKVETYITHGNYCHAIDELRDLVHFHGLLPSRIYYPRLNVTCVRNGLHSVAAGILHKKGVIYARIVDDEELLRRYYCDAISMYEKETDAIVQRLGDYRMGLIFELTRKLYKIL